MLRRVLIAIIAVCVAWAVLDFVIYGVFLESAYQATAQLWRPMHEIKRGLLYLVALVSSACFVGIYTLFIQPKSLLVGLAYGLVFGISVGFGIGYGITHLCLYRTTSRWCGLSAS